jgi:hypothetical protein
MLKRCSLKLRCFPCFLEILWEPHHLFLRCIHKHIHHSLLTLSIRTLPHTSLPLNTPLDSEDEELNIRADEGLAEEEDEENEENEELLLNQQLNEIQLILLSLPLSLQRKLPRPPKRIHLFLLSLLLVLPTMLLRRTTQYRLSMVTKKPIQDSIQDEEVADFLVVAVVVAVVSILLFPEEVEEGDSTSNNQPLRL